MTSSPQFVDISAWQPLTIDWQAYKSWSAASDGIARVSLRSSYGTGYTDAHYKTYRAAAEAAGIQQIIHYHYAYSQYNTPEAEADYQHSVVGDVGPHGILMLDFEETVPEATADWAYRWLARQEQNYGGRLPIIYASDSYIRARLQDARLARFPLVLANWTYSPDARPACPPPWTSYLAIQYSDRAGIPGIPGNVDVNVYLGGGITTSTELPNFPMISQRDGNVNADADCVPTSIAACLEYLTGQKFTGGQIKNAVYGASYTGGTAARAYVDYCAAQGVKLSPMDGNGAQLVADLRAAIAAGHPCLISEPDPYAAGWTHVCAAFKDDGANIVVMDPWIDQPVSKSYATWAAQLQFNEIWVLEKAMITVHDVAGFFTDLGNNVWKCTNGNLLGHGMLGFFCRQPTPLATIGLPRTNEIAIPGHPGVVLQVFERSILCYDPAHTIDNPPGAGDIYAMHIDQVQSPALVQLLTLLGISTQTPPQQILATVITDLQTLRTSNDAAIDKLLIELSAKPA